MPFALTDLRRSYGRSGIRGEAPSVRPYLLAGAELTRQRHALAAAIDWHEINLGRARGDLDLNDLAVIVGDYRLGRCLATCLQAHYRFETRSLSEAVQDGSEAGRRRWSALQEARIGSASDLRLHVFERVAAKHTGFAAGEARETVLAAVGSDLWLDAAEVEKFLWLDAEEAEHLVRRAAAPSVEQLAAEYNRRALETLLVRTVSADLLLPKPNGPAIKRFYFLMKRSGLLADLEMAAGGVRAHLFGPLEVFGPRTRHGDRFARAIVQLLRWMPELGGSARVLVNEKEYALALDGAGTLLASLADPAADDDREEDAGETARLGVTATVAEEASTVQFDSAIEERLYVTLRGMARRGDARGWMIEREPEPLVQDGVVLVPDFALTRGAGGAAQQKVYVEVIGFWTPAYRQRKRRKLSLLSGSVPLLLVVQEQLAGDFHGLPFATLTYRQRPSAADLIRLVERTYGRSDVRQADAAKRLTSVWCGLDETAGVVPDDSLREQLGLAPSDDLRALGERSESAPPEGWCWVPGLGLCHDSWLGTLTEIIAPLVAGTGEEGAALERVREAVEVSGLPRANLAGDHLEAVLPLLGFEVVWASIFEATVRRLAQAGV